MVQEELARREAELKALRSMFYAQKPGLQGLE